MRHISFIDGRWRDEAGGSPTWIRAGGATQEELEALASEVGMHPLSVDDVQNPRQRPKVEDYEDHTFVVIRIPRGRDPEKGWQQVGVWLFADRVVTASPARLGELDAVEKRLMKKGRKVDLGMLFYHIVDSLVDAWFPFMDALEEDVEAAEDAAMDAATQEVLREIRDLKHTVSRVRKLLSPLREAMVSLERGDHPNVEEGMRIFLRDVSDHTIRLYERLEHVREVSLIAQETWNSTLANDQNTLMKRLTVVAALLLLPGLLAGLGGMNFDGIPAWNYWAVTGSILGFIFVGFAVAAWRRWI